jgi:hypothetical protein
MTVALLPNKIHDGIHCWLQSDSGGQDYDDGVACSNMICDGDRGEIMKSGATTLLGTMMLPGSKQRSHNGKERQRQRKAARHANDSSGSNSSTMTAAHIDRCDQRRWRHQLGSSICIDGCDANDGGYGGNSSTTTTHINGVYRHNGHGGKTANGHRLNLYQAWLVRINLTVVDV